jgi:hypothetical protein
MGAYKAINGLLRDLDQRIEVVRAGNAAPELTQSLIRYLAAPQNSDPARIASTG